MPGPPKLARLLHYPPSGSPCPGYVGRGGGRSRLESWPATESGLDLPIQPGRGQMILFHGRPALVERIVQAAHRYVIPRKHGPARDGSTLERIGFDKSTSAGALKSLRESALRLIPVLSRCEVEHHWTRPVLLFQMACANLAITRVFTSLLSTGTLPLMVCPSASVSTCGRWPCPGADAGRGPRPLYCHVHFVGLCPGRRLPFDRGFILER